MATGVGGDGGGRWICAVGKLRVKFTSGDVVSGVVDVGGAVVVMNAVCVVCC